MQLEDFRRAAEMLERADFRGILNISGGEPTLHPDLGRLLRCAAYCTPGARVVLFTNGHWIGTNGWRDLLSSLLAGPNQLVRFSLDRQHAIGRALAEGSAMPETIARIERERLGQAQRFIKACADFGAKPGVNYDFAYKGSLEEAESYTRALGPVPLYTIRFRRDPARRARRMGFFAVDVQGDDSVRVYTTLADIPAGRPLGGLEALPEALAMNRAAVRERR
jgi:hypothetical protein